MSNKNGKGLHPKGHQNVLKMMGYNEAVDDDDEDDMEQQLAALLGQEATQKTTKKKSKTELLDWSIIDAQVASSMKEIGNDSDDNVTEEDENEFMSELTDIVEEDFPSQLGPEEERDSACRSPSYRSVESSDLLYMLQGRSALYKSALDNAQKAGQSSKIRRLQRGVKTLSDLVKQVKIGKTIKIEDIPPEVSGSTSSFCQPQTDYSVTQPPDGKPIEEKRQSVDGPTLKLVNDRKAEYRRAAIQAKQDGDKHTALQHFKLLKQFNPVIEAIEEGRIVDVSKIPPTLQQIPHVGKIENKLDKMNVQPNPPKVKQEEGQQPTGGLTAPEKPLTILQALEQRLQKYQFSEAEAQNDGNGGKARRMGRIVKQYQTAIKSHKAGRSVHLIDLPVPPGYPPIPGIKSEEVNLHEKIDSLLNDKEDTLPPVTSSETTSQLLDVNCSRSESLTGRQSGNPSQSPVPKPSNHYEQQVSFLENRQAAFKRAALSAKRKGDRIAAVNFLRKMKGFDALIEAAKNGLKVDISKVPQPPLEPTPEDLSGAEEQNIFLKGTKSSPVEEDKALYTRLLKSLLSQVNIAQGFAQQMALGGDLSGADSCDRLAVMSQTDYDYVRSCHRHGDAPPRFYYEEKTFNTTKLIPDIENNVMELVVVQCTDLNLGGKDVKLFVEWEFPFPHDNPLKGKTEEISGLHVFRFDERFRVPFNRKLKSSHRAVKSKSLKLEVFYKSGILRRTTSVGTASIKLMPLEKKCELLSVEEIKDGRQTTGKIDVYVRLRTPLNGSESIIASEKWLYVEHGKITRPLPSSSSRVAPFSNSLSPQSSAGVNKTINISSLEVLQFDLKMNERKIAKNRQRGTATMNLEQISRSLMIKFQETKTFLEGGQHAKKEYSNCLRSQYEHLTNEAQMCKKQGKMEQMKLALAKRTVIRKELEKYK